MYPVYPANLIFMHRNEAFTLIPKLNFPLCEKSYVDSRLNMPYSLIYFHPEEFVLKGMPKCKNRRRLLPRKVI